MSKGESPHPICILRGHAAELSSVCFGAPSTELLASSTVLGDVRIWSLRSRRVVDQLDSAHGLGQGVVCVKFDPSSERNLYTQGRDGTIRQWDLSVGISSSKATSQMEIGSQTFCHMSIADNLLLAPSAEYTNFALWDLRTQTKIREFKNQSYADACCSNDSEESKNRGMVTSLHLWYPTSASSASASFSPSSINRPMALAGWEDGTLQLWDILEDRLLDEQKPHSEPVFACHARGNLCMSGGAPSSLSFVNIDSAAGNKFHQESTFTLPNPGISEICIRNDGKLCAVAGWDHRIRLFSGKSRAPLAILKHHTSNVTCLDFAQAPGNPSGVPAGPAWLMAAGSKDTEISIWNLYPPSLSSVSASSSSSSPPP